MKSIILALSVLIAMPAMADEFDSYIRERRAELNQETRDIERDNYERDRDRDRDEQLSLQRENNDLERREIYQQQMGDQRYRH